MEIASQAPLGAKKLVYVLALAVVALTVHMYCFQFLSEWPLYKPALRTVLSVYLTTGFFLIILSLLDYNRSDRFYRPVGGMALSCLVMDMGGYLTHMLHLHSI